MVPDKICGWCTYCFHLMRQTRYVDFLRFSSYDLTRSSGRIWATRQLCLLWIVGLIVYITSNGNYGQVLAGRFVMSLGIGQTTGMCSFSTLHVLSRSTKNRDKPRSLNFTMGRILKYANSRGTSIPRWRSSSKHQRSLYLHIQRFSVFRNYAR